jgi:tRNA-dihydrouridine synthase 2
MSTKFCISQFKGRKTANKALRNAIIKANGYADLNALVKDWTGSDEFDAIKAAIDARVTAPPILLPATDHGSISPPPALLPKSCEETASTPPGWRGNPDPAVVHDAPLLPSQRTPYSRPSRYLKAGSGDADTSRPSAENRTCICT